MGDYKRIDEIKAGELALILPSSGHEYGGTVLRGAFDSGETDRYRVFGINNHHAWSGKIGGNGISTSLITTGFALTPKPDGTWEYVDTAKLIKSLAALLEKNGWVKVR